MKRRNKLIAKKNGNTKNCELCREHAITTRRLNLF